MKKKSGNPISRLEASLRVFSHENSIVRDAYLSAGEIEVLFCNDWNIMGR